MASFYICAGCRARLHQRLGHAPRSVQSVAHFVSLSDIVPLEDHNGDKKDKLDVQRTRRASKSQPSPAFARQHDDQLDFLSRLRQRSAGRYSRYLSSQPETPSSWPPPVGKEESQRQSPLVSLRSRPANKPSPFEVESTASSPPNRSKGRHRLQGREGSFNSVNASRREHNSPSSDATTVFLRSALQMASISPEDTDVKLQEKTEAESAFSTLTEMLEKKDTHFQDIWTFFLDNFCSPDAPARARPSFKDLTMMTQGSLLHAVLKRAVAEWCDGSSSDRTPDPVEVLLKFDESKLAKDRLWGSALWELAFHTQRSLSADGANKSRIALKLVDVWRHFFFRYKTLPVRKQPPQNWTCLPSAKTFSHQVLKSHSFRARMRLLTPRYPTMNDTEYISAALISFNLLWSRSDKLDLSNEQLRGFMPMLVVFAHAMRLSNYATHVEGLSQLLRERSVDKDVVAEVCNDIRNALPHVNAILGRVIGTEDGKSEEEAVQNFLLKRLARAVEVQDIKRVDRMWSETKDTFQALAHNGSEDPVPPRLYDAFLSGWMSLQRPEKAVALWNEMVQRGTQPTNASWTALLNGCPQKRKEDAVTIENLWQKMLESGINPDSYNWNSRIHALMSCREWNLGLRAMQEMGIKWERSVHAAQSSKDATKPLVIAAKPDSATINAALPVLAKSGRRGRIYIGKVLEWAKRYQIRPDHITFNILIGLEMRDGEEEKAMLLLKQMEAMSIAPDIVTFSVIINAVCQSSWIAETPREEVTPKILSLLKDLEDYGLKPNAYIFTTIIDVLLKQHDNLDAAHAILEYMDKRGVFTPAPVWTTLATYYFCQHPPNIAAVDALWTRIIQPQSVRDHILFDRLIEGYSINNEIGKMMTVLMRMSKEGKRPHMQVLMTVVHALVSAGDLARAREVVEDVRRGTGELVFGVRGLEYKDEFWEMVRRLGLDVPDDGEVAPMDVAEEENELLIEDESEDAQDTASRAADLDSFRHGFGKGSALW